MKLSRAIALGTCCLALFAGCSGESTPVDENVGTTKQALVTTFGAGSLVIPMDNTLQPDGIVRAYGLVHALLRGGVPVHWAIAPAKAANGNDFTIPAAGRTVVQREGGAAVTLPVSYRGGPFVVAAANRAAALPIVNAWLAADNVTRVHDVTAGTFDADIERTIVVAPNIAIFEDGLQSVAYANLNGAGIPDPNGNAWTDASPGTLSPSETAGTAGNNADGALFAAPGVSAYAHLTSEHYNDPTDPEVIAEVRSWLDSGPLTHAFFQCLAITAFENEAAGGGNPGGFFLTTQGLTGVGGPPNPLTVRFPSDPLVQIDGAIAGDTGSIESFSLTQGAFRAGVRTLINESDEPTTDEILLLDGRLDGNPANGRITYLAGHNYSLTPGSSQLNGARIFFNSLFASDLILPGNQPNVTFSKAAPASTNGSQITFTLSYTNTGTMPALATVITDAIPAGTAFVSATNGGTNVAGAVTWTIGIIAAGASGSVSFTVSVAADATITNQATLVYRAWGSPRTVTSNQTSTVRDATAPTTTIVSGPPASSTSTSAPFDFSSDDANATFECNLDGAGFQPCTDPRTFVVGQGPHMLEVRARDAFGNVDASPATHSWTVDSIAPETTIVSGPPATTSSPTANFDFSSSDPSATFECSLDGAGFQPCSDPHTFNNVGQGMHTLEVRARDAAGNVDASPATHAWTVGPTVVDAGADASNPTDTDGDGLSDAREIAIGTNPNDRDSDDDGVSDGQEPSFDQDTDGDGLINALDPDSDNDGLFDGTEMGFGCAGAGTDATKGTCRADGDNGTTKTDPLKKDTDDGGASDGSEDANLNGVVDPGERNPTAGNGADDMGLGDTDGDGLSDPLEATLGSNPNDADTDDDGVPDGLEANPGVDTDGDGKRNVSDPDSDGDGLFDGTETGRDCEGAATDKSKMTCIADADPATKTGPLDPDTDNGGVKDGDEDTNKNGRVDTGERNPLVAADDSAADAGAPKPQVIDEEELFPINPRRTLEGGGCACNTIGGSSAPGSPLSAMLGIAAVGLVLARRRRH